MTTRVFSGFDSAWGGRQLGSLCHLGWEPDSNCLRVLCEPEMVDWAMAVDRARSFDPAWDLHVVAVDQGLIVPNETGMRPVERRLASALMKGYGCGAHASNTNNLSCYDPDAGIWRFLDALEAHNYRHAPSEIPGATKGRFYFECYPHPALLGLFDLDGVLNYKMHRRQPETWMALLELLRSLKTADPAVANVDQFVPMDWPQTKQNEDKADSLICGYIAALFWKHGGERSIVLGSLETGYIVTPHGVRTLERYQDAFGPDLNPQGEAMRVRPRQAVAATEPGPIGRTVASAEETGEIRWEGAVQLNCSDEGGNVWCNANPWLRHGPYDRSRLLVWFVEEDGEPVLVFTPFDNQKGGAGMRIGQDPEHRSEWQELSRGARRDNRIPYSVLYRYPSG